MTVLLEPGQLRLRLASQARLRQLRYPAGTARGTIGASLPLQRWLDRRTDELVVEAREGGSREPREAFAFDALCELGRLLDTNSLQGLLDGTGPDDDVVAGHRYPRWSGAVERRRLREQQ